MGNRLSELAQLISRFTPEDGVHPSPLSGVDCIKISRVDRPAKRYWPRCLGVVVQGGKELVLGTRVVRADEGQCTVSLIDVPVTSRILAATHQRPFLGLRINIDPVALSEVSAHLEPLAATAGPLRALYIETATEPMLECFARLIRLFAKPEDARVLGPLVLKELHFHLLKTDDGPAIREFVRAGSAVHNVSRAVHALQADIEEEVDVASLAKLAKMSRSAFFKHFRELIAMSPIQYQKRLRLLEARRLMVEEGETAEGSAYKVGYKSPSQFSREYSRMFGTPPSRDATKIRRRGSPIPAI
jgi:AraC-like DNA-binding protein